MILLPALLSGLMLSGQETGAPPGPAATLDTVEVTAPSTEGVVTLECGFAPSGRLRDCVVISETPPGRGFAEAALQSAGGSRLSRRTLEDAAPDTKVRFTVRFRLPD